MKINLKKNGSLRIGGKITGFNWSVIHWAEGNDIGWSYVIGQFEKLRVWENQDSSVIYIP